MSPRLKILLVITLLGLMIVFGYAIGKYIPFPLDGEQANLFCPVAMAEVVQSAKGDVYNINDTNYVEPKSYSLVTYLVNGEQITNPVFNSVPADLKDEQKDDVTQKEAWQIFTTLIPAKDRQMVSQYLVFTDGSEETLAAVEQNPDDLTSWVLEVDMADVDNKDELLFTLIHEYAHLLTLNASQVSVDEEVYSDPYNLSLLESKAAACPNYFDGGGCSLPNSYINVFYHRFWTDIAPEWQKIDALQYNADLNPYYAGLYQFYLSHKDQFVDDYSTTHPDEDIAESFAYFVFSPRPAGTLIRDQKILFFYEYPELVQLRQSILESACSTIE